ncbi:FAD-dependent oxidoreductase [Novosphingobium sp. PASSN1]|uniref:FAD-dependent oxidoreductase n=1 Tax=Novosphingobium sp. PASSN1 TaxID=2015561 RepID=UPI000BD50FC8|nr:FAD-dependent oxidoreductase [Novosphingobium sp. PASSN1]OYU34794.1 MAG: 3-oxosteroid 1-dehydrogenase [Novosphingobium sp. PASSN1]
MAGGFDEMFDLIVVGSGASGLSGAITAKRRGLNVLVVEKADVWGGTTALSGGGVWAPANRIQLAAGIQDSIEEAGLFLDAVVNDEGLATAPSRRRAFLEAAPRMVDLMVEEGMGWTCDKGHADYQSQAPHSKFGRNLDSKYFNVKKLGPLAATMRRGPAPFAIRLKDIPLIGRGLSSVRSILQMGYVFTRGKVAKALGQDSVAAGESLAAQLMLIASRLGIEVRLKTPLRELVSEDGRICGVVVEGPAGLKRIGSRGGVLLAAGGFAHAAFRSELQVEDGRYSSAIPEDTGDIVAMANGLGAMTAMMDEAWWGSCFVYPGNVVVFCHWERSLPFSICVDPKGRRFVNESADYYEFGQAMVREGISECWLVMDARHRQKYTFGGFFPGNTPKAMFDYGFFKKADTLDGLAAQCGIPAGEFQQTVQRFNQMVRKGRDEDYRRGTRAYDVMWGDTNNKPNPNLGPIEKGPFLAVKINLGDLGTKGGYVTDGDARVLDVIGKPIEGLYAAGNSTASVFGRTYPGPGSTLGPAMTFGYLAGDHVARRLKNS